VYYCYCYSAVFSILSGDVLQTLSPAQNLHRRPRVEWTEAELNYLKDGVDNYGHSWSTILSNYRFDAQRTAADLKEKNRRMKKKEVCLVFFRTECFLALQKIQITNCVMVVWPVCDMAIERVTGT